MTVSLDWLFMSKEPNPILLIVVDLKSGKLFSPFLPMASNGLYSESEGKLRYKVYKRFQNHEIF